VVGEDAVLQVFLHHRADRQSSARIFTRWLFYNLVENAFEMHLTSDGECCGPCWAPVPKPAI